MEKQLVYKINNYESKILEEMTIEKEGYSGLNLSLKSNKYVWVSCRYCGQPNRIKRSKFVDSNAHMGCRKKELKETDSTYCRADVKEKIKKTLIEKYGVDHSSKIEGASNKKKKTWLKKYGVDNPSKSQKIKEKKKQTCLKNYGTEYPLQNKEIFEISKNTLKENYGVERPMYSEVIKEKVVKIFIQKYGCENPLQNDEVKKKSIETFKETVKNDEKNKYILINTLRDSNNKFWEDIKTMSLLELSEKYNFKYTTLTGTLNTEEFKDKYSSLYSFPKVQVQREIYDLIKNILPNEEILFDDKKTISPLELDIYLPAKKIAVEFNGNLWHSEYMLGHTDAFYKHRKKLNLCREKGIYLFQIFEHQWKNRASQIMNFIKTILGKNEINIDARKCKITNNKANQFLHDNHIQGKCNSALKYFNLEYQGIIIASMTASIHHRQNSGKDTVVLSRLCFKENHNVRGGASKLFNAMKFWARENGYRQILSWSDNCWTDGKIYGVLGFQLEEEYGPDYFYYHVKTHEVFSKQSQKKSAVGCPPEIKEVDWCKLNDLYRVWDCGKKKWIYWL